MTNQFEMVFQVPMECNSCVESISKALRSLEGISKFDINLKSNTVTTEGSQPPSGIVQAIRSTGRDAIIRGTGVPNSAAVCILESFDEKDWDHPVKGLGRIVSAGTNDAFIDLTVNGLEKGTYYPSIRKSGNLSNGALSTGKLYYQLEEINVDVPSDHSTVISSLGAKENTGLFSGQYFLPAKLNIDDLIGRSVVLSRLKDEISPDSLCGVIARSAGAWENDKQICSCSGKTVWEERKDAIAKGVHI